MPLANVSICNSSYTVRVCAIVFTYNSLPSAVYILMPTDAVFNKLKSNTNLPSVGFGYIDSSLMLFVLFLMPVTVALIAADIIDSHKPFTTFNV